MSETFRAYQLLIEYRKLEQHDFGGLYIIPHMNDLYIWHGVYFIRLGVHAGRILRFYIQIPKDYPDNEVKLHLLVPHKSIPKLKNNSITLLLQKLIETCDNLEFDNDFEAKSELNLYEPIPPLNPIEFSPLTEEEYQHLRSLVFDNQ